MKRTRLTRDGVRLSPEERDGSLAFALGVKRCMAVLVAPSRRGAGTVTDREGRSFCGLPRETAKGLVALPLCRQHALIEGPPWFRRELRYEVRVGILVWVAARRAVATRFPSRPRCPGCGCGGSADGRTATVCEIVGAFGAGICAPAGSVPGHRVCSGCVTAHAIALGGAKGVHVTKPKEPPAWALGLSLARF